MKPEKQYTPHKTATSYDTKYPNWEDFGISLDSCLYVNQGYGKSSTGDQTLRSEGFSFCSALILKNTKTLESALFHIEPTNLTGKQMSVLGEFGQSFISALDIDEKEKHSLFELICAGARSWNPMSLGEKPYNADEKNHFKKRIKELNKDKIIKACLIQGDVSSYLGPGFINVINNLGIYDIKNILVNTDRIHFSVAFKPKESEILVNPRKQKKVLSYSF